MDADEIFARCAARRRAVADLIETLDDTQLATPSLCGEWDVKTVAAHLTLGIVVSKARFGLAMLRHRGNFDRVNDVLTRELATQPVPRIAAVLREQAGSRFTPPLHGPGAPLTDLVVHTGDLRAPLGLPVEVDVDEAATVFDFLHGFHMAFLPRGRLDGLRLVPDGLDRTWGDGADLTGAPADVIMALFGRAGFAARVGGPGGDVLAGKA